MLPTLPEVGRRRERPPPRGDAETRAVIVAAAAKEFLEHGYDASIDAIARRAGVSKKTIYRLVATKSDLLVALVAEQGERLRRSIDLVGTDGLGAQETLEVVLRRYVLKVMAPETIALHRIIAAECLRFPHMTEAFYREGSQRIFDVVAGILKRLQARGLLFVADHTRAAAMLVEMIVGAPFRRAVFGLGECPSEDELNRLMKEGIALFLHGCAAKRDNQLHQ